MTEKTCRVCGVTKPLFDYHKDRVKKDGHRSACKPCATDISHGYYVKNADRIKTKVSVYRRSYVPRYTREIESRLKNLVTKARGRKTKEFDITLSDLLDLWGKQQGLCAYTKLPLQIEANKFDLVSLDRIDSSKGYVVDNIQLVCAGINVMKMDMTEKHFIRMCRLVSQNNSLAENL